MSKLLERHNLLKLCNKLEIKDTISLTLGQRNEKDINLAKCFKILCSGSYRTVRKEIPKEIRKYFELNDNGSKIQQDLEECS